MTPVIPNEVDKIVMEASSQEDKRFMRSMSKSDVNQVNAALVQKLYESILKYNRYDLGSIPKSKGDIEKIDWMTDTLECLTVLETLHNQHGIPVQDIQEIRKTISIVSRLKRSFEFGFKVNNDYLVILYNTIVMAIMDATSELITNYTTYMVTPNDVKYSTVYKGGRGRGGISIDAIRRFNNLAKDGTLDSTVNTIVTNATKNPAGTRKKEVATESLTVAASVAVGGIILSVLSLLGIKKIITLLRELVFHFYNSRVKFTEYLELQAAFLEMNRLTVQSSNRPASQKIQILQKQEKVILKLRRLADKIKIGSEDASIRADKMLKDENSTLTLSAMEKQVTSNALTGAGIQII